MNRKSIGVVVVLVGLVGAVWFKARETAGAPSRSSRGAAEAVAASEPSPRGLPPPPAGAAAPLTWGEDGSRPTPEAIASARRQADAVRAFLEEAIARRAAPSAAPSREPPGNAPLDPSAASASVMMPAPIGSGNQANEALGRYVGDVIRKDFFPMGGSCYADLQAHQPDAKGRVVLDVTVLGNPAVGGIVDDVTLDPTSTLTDPDFVTCMRESMLAMVFKAPPSGHDRVTFTIPMDLSPDPPPQGGEPVATGPVGTHFHRNHRGPGAHPVARGRITPFVA